MADSSNPSVPGEILISPERGPGTIARQIWRCPHPLEDGNTTDLRRNQARPDNAANTVWCFKEESTEKVYAQMGIVNFCILSSLIESMKPSLMRGGD